MNEVYYSYNINWIKREAKMVETIRVKGFSKEEQYILYKKGIEEVTEGWTEEDWKGYFNWYHQCKWIESDDRSCICSICGMNGHT